MPTPWSRDEVEFIVADYFAMLRAELSDEAVNKAEHNRRLKARLNGRSRASIEFKHANISDAEGDGAGYDIRSFNKDESQRLIEVKTTGLNKYHPFYVSPNELAVSEREARQYHLYRVFRCGRDTRMYTLRGALSSVCRLEPAQYSARVGR